MQLRSGDIEAIFGSEAAEAERDDRLREYFYRNPLFDEVISETAFKLVVGFKGTGKSALMRMSHLVDLSKDFMALWITPDDLGAKVYQDARGASATAQDRMIKAIRIWKAALWQLVARRAADDPSSAERGLAWLRKVDPAQVSLRELLKHVAPPREHAIVALYIDDLDRAWAGGPGDKAAVAGLIYALRDMTRDNRQLRARLSLRNDVYWDVRAFDQGLDKIETNVVNVRWTNHEILVMLVKRVATWMGEQADEHVLLHQDQASVARRLGALFELRIETKGAWSGKDTHKVLLSLVRRRPRDMVKLCTFAAREAVREHRQKILGRDILKIVPEYSMGRIQDLINEFRQILPYVDRLVLGMRPTRREMDERNLWHYRTDRLIEKVRRIVEQIGRIDPLEAAHWLYKMGFLTARRDHPDGFIERRYFDDYPHLLTPALGDAGYSWEVHPAYREALNPRPFDWQADTSVDSWSASNERSSLV